MHNVQASFPSRRSARTTIVGSVCVVIVVALAVAQLSSFEALPELLEAFWPKVLGGGASALGAVLVVTEVFSLPFLLGMYVSPLMRACSLLSAAVVAAYLLMASVYSVGAGVAGNSGILGTHVPQHGLGLLLLATLFIGLTGWYTALSYTDQNRA